MFEGVELEIVFLGTAGSTPTPDRSLPSIAIRRRGELLIFDCGEGTQRQMIKAKLGFPSKFKIFITHLHGDHIFGIPGLLHTLSLLNREKPLEIYGPKGIKDYIEAIKETVGLNLNFTLKIFEISEGLICDCGDYVINAVWVSHSIPTLAYALIEKPRPGKFYPNKAKALGIPRGPLWKKLQMGFEIKLKDGKIVKPEEVLGPSRPGLKVVYSGDTGPCEKLIKLAYKADLLIHECTFDDSQAEWAYEEGHSTPSSVAKIALKARVKRLILTHVSARYKNTNVLEEQAKKIFSNVVVAKDFMRIELKHADL